MREIVARRRARFGRWRRRRRTRDELLVGWDDLGAALGCSARQAQRYADRRIDPLPVWYLHDDGPPRILRSRLSPWRRRTLQGGRGERLIRGWAAICLRIEMSRTGAWEALQLEVDPLPVVTTGGRPRAYASALRDWKERRLRTRRQRREQQALAAMARGRTKGPGDGASSGDRARSATGSEEPVKGAKTRPAA